MKTIYRLSVIRHKSKIKKDWRHKDLFRILRKKDIWITAYENIKNNKRTFITKPTKISLEKKTLKELTKLRNKVTNKNYQFKKKNFENLKLIKQKKLLESPAKGDEIVQEVIRIILEAIYEPCFSKQNFTFSYESKTYNIFKYIESRFCKTDWIVKKDLRDEAFLTINHIKLHDILKRKIDDIKFIHLILKLLKSSVFQQQQSVNSSLNMPPKNTIYSIIINIYYSELDKWIKKKTIMSIQSHIKLYTQKSKQLSYQIGKRIEQKKKLKKKSKDYEIVLKEIKILKKKRITIFNSTKKSISIEYCRYINDWLIGIKGNQIIAKELKAEICKFIMIGLKQTLYSIHTKIIDLNSEKFKFLAYEIYFSRNRKFSYYTKSDTRIKYSTNLKLKLDVPINSILQRMENKGYIKKLVKGYRPISKANYTTLEDKLIVSHFAQVWKKIANYYSGCNNIIKLKYIHYLLYISCAMTLSHRHKSSISKIFTKHGKTLTVFNHNNISINFPYRQNGIVKNKKEFKDPFQS